jgi:hypothetical protein
VAAGDTRDRAAARRAPGSGRSAVADRRPEVSRPGIAVTASGTVVGPVPALARAVGVLLVLAGLAGAAGAFPTYLVVGGHRLALATGVGSALVALFVPVADLLVGTTLLRGRLPKFGLAFAGISAALAVGPLLIEIYRGSSSTARPAIEVLAGRPVLTSSVHVGAGWVLGAVALALTIVAGVAAALAWGRTVMDDDGGLDPVRSLLAGGAVLLGLVTVLCMTLPAADLPDKVVTDPATGMETVVTQEGAQALLERPGLALLGGLLLAGAVLLCSVIAASLRPRLAAVGGLLAIAVAVLGAGLTGLRDALSSAQLEWTVPGAGLLLAGVGYALLTLLAWRARAGRTPVRLDERGSQRRPARARP